MFNIDSSKVPPIFKEVIEMINNYANFNDRTTVRGYWMAALWAWVASVVLNFIPFIGPVLAGILGLFLFVPQLAIAVRRLRDNGKHWAWLFLLLIPIVGWIVILIFLCLPSVPEDGTPQV